MHSRKSTPQDNLHHEAACQQVTKPSCLRKLAYFGLLTVGKGEPSKPQESAPAASAAIVHVLQVRVCFFVQSETERKTLLHGAAAHFAATPRIDSRD